MVLAVAAESIVDQGINLTEACEELNNRRLFARSGVAWSVGNLRNRLHGETIHDGYVVHRKTDRGNGKNATLRCPDGTPVHGDQVRIGVPPIFSCGEVYTGAGRGAERSYRCKGGLKDPSCREPPSRPTTLRAPSGLRTLPVEFAPVRESGHTATVVP